MTSIEYGDPHAWMRYLMNESSPENKTKVLTELTLFPMCWMQRLLPVIGNRTLETICLPRSHDAGMYAPISQKVLGSPSTVITQTNNILTQLSFGVRMFDIRPCFVRGEFRCGHYQYIKDGDVPESVRTVAKACLPPEIINRYSGGEGASLAELIDQVNEFTRVNKGEVIILEMSHAFNFDREVLNSEWGFTLNQEEYNKLTSELGRLNNLFMSDQGPDTAITKLKINELIGSGQSAVIVTTARDGDVQLDPHVAGRGFFNQSVLAPIEHHRYDISQIQSTNEAICGFIRDHSFAFIANIVASMIGKDSAALRDELWSIVDVARKRNREELPKVADGSPQDGGCWNFVSVDNVEDVELLKSVTKIIGRAITGKKAELCLKVEGSSTEWTFVEKE